MKFLIFNTLELDTINPIHLPQIYNHITRTSIDGSKILVSWEGGDPIYVSQLTTKEGPYDELEIEDILIGSVWVDS